MDDKRAEQIIKELSKLNENLEHIVSHLANIEVTLGFGVNGTVIQSIDDVAGAIGRAR